MNGGTRKKCFEIAKSFQRGDFLFWKKYKFSDGNERSKYVLILSSCIKYKFYIYTLPTSKINFYKNPLNNIDTIWIPAKRIKFLPFKTVIDLKHIKSERASRFGEKLYDGTLLLKGRFPAEIIKEIEEAVENAKTLNPLVKKTILEG